LKPRVPPKFIARDLGLTESQIRPSAEIWESLPPKFVQSAYIRATLSPESAAAFPLSRAPGEGARG
jgi:hypothetical protein